MTSTSSVTIVPVETKKQLRQFINFSLDLYKDNPYYVPELAMDTKASLTTNPALSFCQCQPFLAYKDGKVAGRVVALINPRANLPGRQMTSVSTGLTSLKITKYARHCLMPS